MSLIRFRQLRDTALFGWLLLFLLARGMLAPGFMPAFGAGGFSIELCTPQGAKTVWIGGEQTAEAHGSLECPFGMSLGLAALPAQAPAFGFDHTQEAPRRAGVATQASTASGVFQARGPPRHF
jgi:hypothetical protein